MALTLTRVTGAVDLPNGETPDNGSIVFQLQNWDKDGLNLFVPGPVVVPIALDGSIDVLLQATDATDAAFTYGVRIRYFSRAAQAMTELVLPNVAVPSAGPVVLADLLSLPAPTPNVPDLIAQAFAAAARAKASAQGMVDNSEESEANAAAARASAQTATERATAAAASAKQAADTASSVGIVIATQADAEAGTDNGKLMTSLRTLQSFVKNYNDRVATASQVIAGTATNLYVTPATLLAWLTDRLATQAEAEAGTATGKLMTPLRSRQGLVAYLATWFTGKLASTAQAVAGTANDVLLTPLRLRQAFNATGTAPVYAVRAWGDFTEADGGTGAMTIHGVGNATITRVSAGIYKVSFITQMPSEAYAVSVSGKRSGNTFSLVALQDGTPKTASEFTLTLRTSSNDATTGRIMFQVVA